MSVSMPNRSCRAIERNFNGDMNGNWYELEHGDLVISPARSKSARRRISIESGIYR
jgi:hypothetical protein